MTCFGHWPTMLKHGQRRAVGRLPVVTCAGETFASRVAGSCCTDWLPELVTLRGAYEALALELAQDPTAAASPSKAGDCTQRVRRLDGAGSLGIWKLPT